MSPAPFTFADAREILTPQGNGVIPGFAEPSGDAQRRPDAPRAHCYSCTPHPTLATHVATKAAPGWPLCEYHAWPFAFIAGWEPVEIDTPEGEAATKEPFWRPIQPATGGEA